MGLFRKKDTYEGDFFDEEMDYDIDEDFEDEDEDFLGESGPVKKASKGLFGGKAAKSVQKDTDADDEAEPHTDDGAETAAEEKAHAEAEAQEGSEKAGLPADWAASEAAEPEGSGKTGLPADWAASEAAEPEGSEKAGLPIDQAVSEAAKRRKAKKAPLAPEQSENPPAGSVPKKQLPEDTEEDEEELEEQQDQEEERRAYRRSRRIRNEVLAYLSVLLVFVLIAGAAFGGVHVLRSRRQADITVDTEESTEDIHDYIESLLGSEEVLPTEVVAEITPEDRLDEYLDTMISGMTIYEKVAGLLIATPEQLTGVATATMAGSSTQEAIQNLPLGGLVYYRKNMESESQLTEMLTNVSGYSKYPLFLAVNEGGDDASSVQNSSISVTDVLSPGETADADSAYEQGSKIGQYLSQLHFNVDFAPTADVLENDNASVKSQSYGSDAAANAEKVAAFVRGLQDQGISAALKTFPGTGNLTTSTSDGTVSTDKTREAYDTSDFVVFKAGIEAGADFVMVSNIVASELSGGVEPCTMSETVVTGILRNEFGFDGVIITEPMNVTAITDYYSAEEAAVAALKAGCDMILMPENLNEAYQGILTAVENGSVAEARINDSLKRVLRIKYAYKLEEFANE